MIKHLQKIGNSKGIIIDKPILDLLHVEENGAFEVIPKDGGLFLKHLSAKQVYRKILSAGEMEKLNSTSEWQDANEI